MIVTAEPAKDDALSPRTQLNLLVLLDLGRTKKQIMRKVQIAAENDAAAIVKACETFIDDEIHRRETETDR